MHYAETEFLNVDDGSSPLRISSNFYGFKCYDVVHSLDGDVTGHAWLDDSGGAPCGRGYMVGWLVRVVLIRLDDSVPGWCSHGDWARLFTAAWTYVVDGHGWCVLWWTNHGHWDQQWACF